MYMYVLGVWEECEFRSCELELQVTSCQTWKMKISWRDDII